MEEKVYSIVDLLDYSSIVRDGAAKSFCEDYTENLDDFITVEQVIKLVKQFSLGKSEKGEYLINDEIFEFTFDKIREQIYHAGLSKLASKDVVEVAYNSENDEWEFWLNDSNKTKIESMPSDEY